MICRAIYIIDARVIMPGLKKHLDKAGWRAPIVFDKQTGEFRHKQSRSIISICDVLEFLMGV